MSEASICPGLFYATLAQDGILSRIRVPGGILTLEQCQALADLADQVGGGYIQITNRANVQIREVETHLSSAVLQDLQALGLAASLPEVDAIRNVMGSPTAGIDSQAILDTRPLIQDWNRYLSKRSDFAILSSKFSVCIDGAEAVSVRERPNDMTLAAVKTEDGDLQLRLHLSSGNRGEAPVATAVVLQPQDTVAVLAALTEVYRDYTLERYIPERQGARKPRLRELLQTWGVETYLHKVEQRLCFRLNRADCSRAGSADSAVPLNYAHLGIHPQRQLGLSYAGIGLPLGRLQSAQLRGLAALVHQYGSKTLRLTPWQTVLLPDIPDQQVDMLRNPIEDLELQISATHPSSAMVACSGTAGCRAAATDTQRHALTLTTHLERSLTLDVPVNIHFSGCEKSCAQHGPADITLVGTHLEGAQAYGIYIGSCGSQFGQPYTTEAAPQIPFFVEKMLKIYSKNRRWGESFGAFANRHSVADFKQLFSQNSEQQ